MIIEDGDSIFTGNNLISFYKGIVCIYGMHMAKGLCIVEDKVELEDFPVFKRPPRIVKRVPEDRIIIIKPEKKEKKEKGGLAKLIIPPLVTIATTVAMGIMMNRGIYVYFMAAASIVTTIFSITTYFQNKKDAKIHEEKRIAEYKAYLLGLRKRLYGLKEKQKEAMLYNAPSIREIVQLAVKRYR